MLLCQVLVALSMGELSVLIGYLVRHYFHMWNHIILAPTLILHHFFPTIFLHSEFLLLQFFEISPHIRYLLLILENSLVDRPF